MAQRSNSLQKKKKKFIRRTLPAAYLYFPYNNSAGEFILTKPRIRMSQAARRQYSVNESYSASWDPRVREFIERKKRGDRPTPQR